VPLTAAAIKQAAPRASAYELNDSDGLVLRVLPSGTRSWCVYYWERGRKRRATVGRYPDVGLKVARAERDQVKARAAGADAIQMEAFAAEYLATTAAQKRSTEQDARILHKDIIPVLGDRPVVQITRRECTAVIDRVQQRCASEMAARTHAVLRRLLQVAVERGIREDNPASRMGVRQGEPRDRVLGTAELADWWPRVLSDAPPAPRLALALVLATGQRLGEVLALEPREIDRVDQLWLMPAAKAKNGHAHTVPLTEWATGLIFEARSLWPGSQYVIPVSADTVRTHMHATVAAAEIDRATPHDLRRTVATWLGRLGYNRTVQDKVLNHVDQSVGAIYDRYAYLDEKRAALEAWAERFRQITGGG